jgi:phage repressor protein C with HTH and peptisase S24 domain
MELAIMLMSMHCAEKIPHGQAGIFPHDSEINLPDKPQLMAGRDFSEVLARIEAKAAALGLSDRELSLRAVNKPDLLRDMRRRQGLPRGDRLAEIARVLGTTSDWLLNGGEEGESEARAALAAMPVRSEVIAARDEWRTLEPSQPVPLLGSAVGGTAQDLDEHIELTELHLGEVLEYLARPPSLAGDLSAYAVTVVGDSMAPRFEPGETAFVSPRAAVGIGDDVIVQLKGNGSASDRVTMVLIKRLVRRSSAFVELAQFNPPMTFRLPAERVAAIHRVRGRL